MFLPRRFRTPNRNIRTWSRKQSKSFESKCCVQNTRASRDPQSLLGENVSAGAARSACRRIYASSTFSQFIFTNVKSLYSGKRRPPSQTASSTHKKSRRGSSLFFQQFIISHSQRGHAVCAIFAAMQKRQKWGSSILSKHHPCIASHKSYAV